MNKRQELAVLDAEIRRQEAQVSLSEQTWTHDVAAARAEVDRAQAEAGLAAREEGLQRELAARSAASVQRLDEATSRRAQTGSALESPGTFTASPARRRPAA